MLGLSAILVHIFGLMLGHILQLVLGPILGVLSEAILLNSVDLK